MKRFVALLTALLLPVMASASTLTADADVTTATMSDTLYGLFFEDINCAADGGLYAELLQNRSFEYEDILNPQTAEHYNGWAFNLAFGATGTATVMTESPLHENNPTYMRVDCQEGEYRFANLGYQAVGLAGGIPVEEGKTYRCSVWMRNGGGFDGQVEIALTKRTGKSLAVPKRFTLTDEWQKYELTFKPSYTEDAVLSFILHGTGAVDIDMASLIPADAFGADWPGGGLRADLVQALKELHPAFLRFPGGCVAEGSYYRSNFYDWKDTVGPVETRRENFNTWGYMQSYGLGYYEYFMLAEAIGAEPLPVVHSGLLCQARDVKEESLTIEETRAYAQDLLDLIEFANGDVTTPWGALRTEMGHPEPFHLKYLGIGNENWDTPYWSRFDVLYQAVKEAYPEMEIVSSAGPVAEGALPAYAWRMIRAKYPDTIVDEHYYMSGDWFLNNVGRYDGYPRTTRVFVGEYAVHEDVQANGRRPNSLYSALCEAAYMTGLERNSDVVVMASYAPLMARDGMQQWTPDMIWFNAREVLLTPNYHVQAMFAMAVGDQVVDSSCEGGNKLLYHVVTRTEDKLYVKLVNVAAEMDDMTLRLAGVPDGKASFTRLTGERNAVNTFTDKEHIAPTKGVVAIENGEATMTLPAYSVTILTFALK
ncbi:MAG: alpha-L-arabinofuranosidase C-terminal domain-containing protein [Clostridiales bacterium]|nr:alpha-L-arabinofuranosidase C-terminal domain-containing protein [Clostridiales bacterium]